MSAYGVKFKGLRNRTIVRERATKREAWELHAFLARHGVAASVHTIRDNGQLGKAQVAE